MTRTIVILTLLACCMPIRAELSKPEDKPAEEIRMSKPLDLSHAGLQIAIPLGFIRNELRLPLVPITPQSEERVSEALVAAGISAES